MLGSLTRRAALLPLLVLGLLPAMTPARAQSAPATPARPAAPPDFADFDCGLPRATESMRRYLEGVREGHIVRPAPPVVMPRSHPPVSPADGGPPPVTAADLFLFPDSSGLLLTSFSDEALFDLMTDAANALLAERGDEFDFVGYFLNFEPDHLIGAAFYLPVFNDVLGVGDMGGAVGQPGPTFDLRDALGLAGESIEGYVMMWNIDSGFWEPGSGPGAAFTRLVLGQEFEHRYAVFLPPLVTGEELQGDDFGCGRTLHWNWKVDGQGSGMEISEWVGTSPAVLAASNVSFNTDIPGSVFSYTDLYLMGYVTPAQMDAGNSQLRYLQTSDCFSDYSGAIKTLGSADLIAAAGPRVPSAANETHDYRTGWIVFHLPGAPPTAGQAADIVGILNQQQADWSLSTLGLGTMDNNLPPVASFTSLGGGLAGLTGVPVFSAVGSLVGGTKVKLSLTNARPFSLSTLVTGFSLLGAPFKGGIMVPDPDFLLAGLSTGAAGSVQLTGTWPVGIPSGTNTWYQHWIVDAAGPKGFAASNALRATSP